jgi:hypothetical protein
MKRPSAAAGGLAAKSLHTDTIWVSGGILSGDLTGFVVISGCERATAHVPVEGNRVENGTLEKSPRASRYVTRLAVDNGGSWPSTLSALRFLILAEELSASGGPEPTCRLKAGPAPCLTGALTD